jgi:peptidoglycan/xylan/chitin deacetylase (PgdA/CDA1 family)
MTDAQLRDAAAGGAGGVEIGSHTLTHPFLVRLDPAAAQRELADAQSALQQRLGLPIQTLAYPYGSCDNAVAAAAKTLYRAACTVQMNIARPTHNRWQLPRLDMYYWRSPTTFNWFGTPKGRAYLTLRRMGRAAGAALRK